MSSHSHITRVFGIIAILALILTALAPVVYFLASSTSVVPLNEDIVEDITEDDGGDTVPSVIEDKDSVDVPVENDEAKDK